MSVRQGLPRWLDRAIEAFRTGERHPSLTVRLLHGVSWQIAMNLAGRLGTFTVAIVQARILGKAGYGELGMVLSTLTLFGLLSSAAGGQTCTKFVAEVRSSDPVRAARIVEMSIAVTLAAALAAMAAIALTARHLATEALHAPQLTPLLWLAAIALGLEAVTSTVSGVLLGLQRFRTDSLLRLVQIGSWLVLTAFLSSSLGVLGAMWAYTLSHAAGLAVYLPLTMLTCREEGLRFQRSGLWTEWPVLVQYSLPLLLHAAVCMSAVWLGNAILARQAGGFAALGGYTAAVQFRTVVLQLPVLVQSVVWPAMAELYGTGQQTRLGNLFRMVLDLLWAGGLCIALLMIGLGNLPLLAFGRTFGAERQVMALVMMTTSLSLISGFAGLGLQVVNRTWLALTANIVYASTSIAASLVLVPQFGGRGLALAFVIGTFVQASGLLLLVRVSAPELYRGKQFSLTALSVVLCAVMILVTGSDSPGSWAARTLVFGCSVLFIWRYGIYDGAHRLVREFSPNSSRPFLRCTLSS